MKRCVSLLAILGIVGTLLSGCSFVSGDVHGQAIHDEIKDQLETQEPGPVGTVDVGATGGKDWERAIIVCRGASQRALEEALGFSWTDGPKLDNVNFLSMIVYVHRDQVVDWFSAGQDDAVVDHWYFTLCSSPEDPGYDASLDTPVASLSRDTALKFTFSSSTGFSYWYVSAEELSKLAGASGH